MPATSAAVAQALSADQPRRMKLRLEIMSEEFDDRLLFRIAVPLDRAYDAERMVLEEYSHDVGVDIGEYEYVAAVNLKSEGQELVSLIEQILQEYQGLLAAKPIRKVEEYQLRDVLTPLAARGQSLFRRLFAEPDEIRHHGAIEREQVRRAVLSALARPQRISVRAPVPLFPWAFIFDDLNQFRPKVRSTLDPLHFWGFQHEIQEDCGITGQKVRVHSPPELVAAICTEADTSGWHSDDGHPLRQLGERLRLLKDVEELGTSLADFHWDAFYFFGHADNENPDIPSRNWLRFNKQTITIDELQGHFHAPRFQRYPVVAFLNGCKTAPLRTLSSNSIVGFFIRQEQPVCCVATIASIPHAVGAEFAREFWQAFLGDRKYIGEAVLSARLALLRRQNNPLGLFYNLLGKIDLHIDRPVTT